jgi:hypothetical protein
MNILYANLQYERIVISELKSGRNSILSPVFIGSVYGAWKVLPEFYKVGVNL